MNHHKRIQPTNIIELCEIVRRARDTGRHLKPVSSRVPLGTGVVREPATELLDMSGFDRVVRADRRNRMLMFEAGVDFAALHEAATGVGLRSMLPLCPRGGKSALTSYLDRTPTIYPRFQWDIADPLLCTEVVLGTGELLRTGGAAGPGSLEDQWRAGDAQKNPMGPGPADLMRLFQGARGAFGVVTWCTAKAEPIGLDERLYVVGSERIEPLVEMTYKMLRRGHPDICFMVDGGGLAALRYRSRRSWSSARVRMPAWNLVFSVCKARIAGDDKLAYVRRELDDMLSSVGLGHSLDAYGDTGALLETITNPAASDNQSWWKHAGQPGSHSVFLHTTMDRVPALLDVARKACRTHGVDDAEHLRYVQPQLGGRCCHLEFVFPGESSVSMAQLITALTRALAKAGGYFSLPHGGDPEVAVEGATSLPLMRRLCDIFDPHGVFAPVGPAHLRGGSL